MTDDAGAVRAANDRFYRAFERLALAEMEPLWAHGEHVACIHPGWPMLNGWGAVREAWDAIFRNTVEMRFTLVRVEVRGELAWARCTENILSQTRGNLAVTAILATNLFERQGAEWLVVHHQASHVLAAPGAPEPAGP